ncbi:MAG: hypothetical protein JSV84_00535, partial [Gemmatimonadota bacterium]
ANLGPIAPLGSRTVTVNFTASAACGVTIDTALVQDAQDEYGSPVPDGQDTSFVNVIRPEVQVTKILLDPPGGISVAGDSIVFRITIQNTGNSIITFLPLSDNYPETCIDPVSATVPWNGDNGSALMWNNLGPLAPTNSVNIDVTFQAIAPCDPALNLATVSGAIDEFGFIVPQDQDDAGVTIEAQPEFSLRKTLITPSGGVANVGDPVVFHIVVKNTGPTSLATVPLRDEYDPICLGFDSASPVQTVQSSGVITWNNIGPITAGDSAIVILNFVAFAPCGVTVDTAIVAGAQDAFGAPAPDDSATAPVELLEPGVRVTKTRLVPSVSKLYAGEPVTFEILLENTGAKTVTTVPLEDFFDPGCLSYVSASPSPNIHVGGSLIWSNLGPLVPGGSRTVTVNFTTVSACGVTIDTAEVVGAQDEFGAPVPGDSDTAFVDIVEAEVTVTKSRTVPVAGVANVGEAVTFEILLQNTGSTTLTTVPLIDDYDSACLSFVSALPVQTSQVAGAIFWSNLGPIAPGNTIPVTVNFTALAPCGATIDTAEVSGAVDEFGTPVPDDSDTAAVILAQTGLQVTKTRTIPAGAVELGDTVAFEILLENTGSAILTTVPLSESYDPLCLSFESASPLQTTQAPGSVTWDNAGPIVPGGNWTVLVKFTAIALCGVSIDTATVKGAEDEYGTPLPDQSDTSQVNIVQTGMTVTKTLTVPTIGIANVGEPVVFEIEIENTGSTTLTTVPLVDDFDPGCLSFVSASPVQSLLTSGTVSWNNVGPIGPSATQTVTVNFTALSPCGVTNDTATVSGAFDEFGIPLPEGTDDASVQLGIVDLDISKELVDPADDSVEINDSVEFRIVLHNTGTTTITTLPLTDTFPSLCLDYVSASPVPNSVTAGQLTWNNLGPLASGAYDTVVVELEAISPCGNTVNTATVTGALDEFGTPVPEVENDETVYLYGPCIDACKRDILLVDADLSGDPSPGDTLLYEVTISNIGNDVALGAAFADTPDVNSSLVVGSVTTTIGSVTEGNTPGDVVVGVDVGTIPNGGAAVIEFEVAIHYPLPVGVDEISNQGEAVCILLIPVRTNDCDTPDDDDPTDTPLNVTPALEVSKKDSIVGDISPLGFTNPGDTLLYTVVLSNPGNIGISGVALIDTPDVNTSLIVGSVTTTQGSILLGNLPGNTSVWVSIGTINGGGDSDTVTFQVEVNAPLPYGTTQVENQGWGISNQTPEEPSDDPDTGPAPDPTTTPLVMPEFEVEKTDSFYGDADGNSVLSPLDTMYYEITVTNVDSVPAVYVTVVDTPGAHISLVPGSVTTTQGSVILGNFAWNWYVRVDVGTLAPSASAVITFLATVDCLCPLPPGGVYLGNQAWLGSSQMSGQPSDDPDTPASNDPTLTPMDGYEIYILGQITYYSNGEPVPDVVVSLSGDGTGSANTDENGEYRLSSFSIPDLCLCNDYTVTPSKIDNWCGAVTDYDATLVRQYVLGQISLTPEQLIAADVSGNGQVTMIDANLIEQLSVHAINSFPVGDWAFLPESISYPDLDSVETDGDFIGILYGDVSGNWEPCDETPDISVNPLSLDMTLTQGEVGFDTLIVCNAASGILTFTVSEAPIVGWLSEVPTSGSIYAYRCDTVAVTFDATGLSPGDYYPFILIDSNDPDEPQVMVAVHLKVEAGIPDITVYPMSFDKTVAEGNWTTDVLHICNDGQGSLNFSLSETVGWLSESSTAGTVGPSLCDNVTVTFNATSLSPGDYATHIMVSSNDPDEPTVSVVVNLHVEEISEPDIGVTPSSLVKVLPEGGIAVEELTISNDGSATLTFNINESSSTAGSGKEEGLDIRKGKGSENEVNTEDVPWLSEFPTSGSVSAGNETDIDVTFNATLLAAGDYSATLIITSNDPDEPVKIVPVDLHVYASGPCTPLGDVNGDDDIDILDVVRLANIILEIPPPPTFEEECRGDCNEDGGNDILDVVGIVNLILGTGACPPAPTGTKPAGHSVRIEASPVMNGRQDIFDLALSVSNDVDLRGIQLTLRYDPSEIDVAQCQPSVRTADMTVASNHLEGRTRVLIYSPYGQRLLPGDETVLTFPIRILDSERRFQPIHLTLGDVILAIDCTEAVLPEDQIVVLKPGSYGPDEFVLFQNYPNPFNATTDIGYRIAG